MPVIATSAAPGPQIWPLSLNAYHALSDLGLIPERTELLYGQVFRKMSKSPLHTFLHQFLAETLQKSTPAGMYVRSEQPLACADSEPEPDLALVRGSKEDYRHSHPHTAEFVIEVCVTSHEYDRSKLRAYASIGVKECWLVLGPEKKIEVHRQPAADAFAVCSVHGPGSSLANAVVPGFEVNLQQLFSA